MLNSRSFPLFPRVRCAFMDSDGAICAQHTPRQNHLLAALPLADYERLLPHLESTPLPIGRIIHQAGNGQPYLYFPTSGIVSRFCVMQNGASGGIAVTGNEGVVGVSSFLGGDSTPSQAEVLIAGHAYRLGAGLMKREFRQGGALSRLLLRYALTLIGQTGQIAVCNRHHTLKQQLCRCILSSLDRLPSNEVAMTHELIANVLGVRREGVSEAAAMLQKAGLIRYSRGRITVLDRSRLEAQVCECYAVVKREYDQFSSRRYMHESLQTLPA